MFSQRATECAKICILRSKKLHHFWDNVPSQTFPGRKGVTPHIFHPYTLGTCVLSARFVEVFIRPWN